MPWFQYRPVGVHYFHDTRILACATISPKKLKYLLHRSVTNSLEIGGQPPLRLRAVGTKELECNFNETLNSNLKVENDRALAIYHDA